MDAFAKSSRRKTSTGVLFGVGLGLLALTGLALAGDSGPPPKPKPKPDPLPPPYIPPTPPFEDPAPDPAPKPDDPPAPDPDPPAPPPEDGPVVVPPGSLGFDLTTNWGGLPTVVRERLARIELAAKVPGLARALGVKWWQAFRAKQPVVTVAEAAVIAAKNPDLCRLCSNPADGPSSASILNSGIKQGWPTPLDVAGWAAASYGLGDMLGGVAVFTGIHTDKGGLPDFINAPNAKAFIQRWEASGMASAYSVRRVLVSDKYKVLVPGVNAVNGDSYQTWGNIFAAYAYPDAYAKQTQQAIDTKKAYLGRAQEIGIDLSEVAYPWPPGTVYKAPDWKASVVWKRLKEYASMPVVDIGGGQGVGVVPVQEQPGEVALAGGIVARVFTSLKPEQAGPLVFLLHGKDADEQQLLARVQLDQPARYAFLRAPNGRWFDEALMGNAATLGPQLDAATAKAVAAGQQLSKLYPATTKVMVVGYSQGGAIAYRVAAQGLVSSVVAVAGYLPPALRPSKYNPVKLWGVHGSGDLAVPLAKGQETYETFIFNSMPQGFEVVQGGDHGLKSLAPAMNAAIAAMIKAG